MRALSLDARLQLAGDDDLDAAWRERERRRVAADVAYFIRAYGHVQDDEGGPPVPFAMWVEQAEVLVAFQVHDRVVVLKARQLGLTWLALHFGYHLIAFEPAAVNAVVLGLSQDGGYAKALLEKARRIRQLLPPFLRHAEDRETRDSKSEMKLLGRGRFVSLPGTPSAPRSHQAQLAICDEWAFVRNGNAGPTMTALMPAAAKIIAISTGNGPPDEEGWGQSFAQLYERAASGEDTDWHAVFLPASTAPARDSAWRENEQRRFDTDEEFLAEYPEEPDEGLIGAGKDRYFKLAHVNAAVAAGAALDALLGTEDMPPPAGEAIDLGLDFGEGTAGYVVWPLEAGGVYIPPIEGEWNDLDGNEVDLPAHGEEPGAVTDALHAAVLDLQEVDPRTGQLVPPLREDRYDAAGVQSMRTFLARARARHLQQYEHKEVRSRKVPFKEYKVETAGYLRRLFKRVGEGRTVGIIAISPANEELIRQTRGLESGPGGVWKKAEDQHGPDAIVAGVQRIARRHRELRGE